MTSPTPRCVSSGAPTSSSGRRRAPRVEGSASSTPPLSTLGYKVWISAGFAPFRLLDVMEMALGAGIGAPEHEVEATNVPTGTPWWR